MSFKVISVYFFVFLAQGSYGNVMDPISCDFDTPLKNAGLCNYTLKEKYYLGAFSVTDGAPRQSTKLDGPLSGIENSGT